MVEKCTETYSNEHVRPLRALDHSDLLNWDNKASHPWILTVEIKYDGKENRGMPNTKTYEFLNEIEEEILKKLKDKDGYLNVGRVTADGVREIYFACKEFRKPCKTVDKVIANFSEKITIQYDIYKDKYWRSLEKFKG